MTEKPSLTHIAIHARDLEATLAFYSDYCGLEPIHQREDEPGVRVVWIAEPGREERFVIVVIEGGPGAIRRERDFSHFGFSCADREAVERLAARAEKEGRLAWPLCDAPAPLGYFCGVEDPNGNMVEFSHGQPVGPYAEPGETAA
jgi:catechol 2,3-dioxygenase-like lactoylglutathione lyase family enzyme